MLQKDDLQWVDWMASNWAAWKEYCTVFVTGITTVDETVAWTENGLASSMVDKLVL